MTIRKIATVGHPVLRERARELTADELASPDLQRLIDDMIDTMRDANGAGLAANQVHDGGDLADGHPGPSRIGSRTPRSSATSTARS